MAFRKYKGKNSSITEYEHGVNYVRVRFGNAKSRWNPKKTYQWTSYGIGEDRISEMKKLADKGSGLDDYIARNCTKNICRVY